MPRCRTAGGTALDRDDATLLELAPVVHRPVGQHPRERRARGEVVPEPRRDPAHQDEREHDQAGDDRRRRALLFPDDGWEDRERQDASEGEQPGRPRMDHPYEEKAEVERDAHDERRDRIGRERKAPARRVGAAAIELMEDRPHLTHERGDATRELGVKIETQGARHRYRQETLRAVERAAHDARCEPDALREIATAQLALADRAQVHAVRARDPVREGNGREQVGHDDRGYRHVAILLAGWTTACSVASWRERSPRRSSMRTMTCWRSTTSSLAPPSTCWSCRGSTSNGSRTSRTSPLVAGSCRPSGRSRARAGWVTTSAWSGTTATT